MKHLGGLDADVLIDLRVREGQLHGFIDILHLLLKAAHVCIGLQGRLLHLSPRQPNLLHSLAYLELTLQCCKWHLQNKIS